jgi:raffinose/stachyose/melibiose transport system permease protein/N-acetylglucosamine transport system permease protein
MEQVIKTPVKGKARKSVMRSPAMIAMSVIFWIYGLSILFVLVQGLGYSLMTDGQYSDGMIFPTKGLHLINYVNAFSKLVDTESGTNLLGMTLNSLWYAGGSSFFGILFSSITAYILSKYRFPGRNALYMYAVVTMMLPIMGSAAASIKFYHDIGILDTNFMIVMFASSFGDNFIMQFATFKGVSWEYAEAAFIDGASHFKVWYMVMIPQAMSTMVALFVVGFIGRWADSDTALLFMKTHPTIASGLYKLSHRNSYNVPVLFAGFMISMLPVLGLYVAFQKTIMDIQIGGGLKG